ncbi:hypothetical protein MMC25_001300 [Agyrium rufum]|nr:hypothetical protein [Agyrium rufum]
MPVINCQNIPYSQFFSYLPLPIAPLNIPTTSRSEPCHSLLQDLPIPCQHSPTPGFRDPLPTISQPHHSQPEPGSGTEATAEDPKPHTVVRIELPQNSTLEQEHNELIHLTEVMSDVDVTEVRDIGLNTVDLTGFTPDGNSTEVRVKDEASIDLTETSYGDFTQVRIKKESNIDLTESVPDDGEDNEVRVKEESTIDLTDAVSVGDSTRLRAKEEETVDRTDEISDDGPGTSQIKETHRDIVDSKRHISMNTFNFFDFAGTQLADEGLPQFNDFDDHFLDSCQISESPLLDLMNFDSGLVVSDEPSLTDDVTPNILLSAEDGMTSNLSPDKCSYSKSKANESVIIQTPPPSLSRAMWDTQGSQQTRDRGLGSGEQLGSSIPILISSDNDTERLIHDEEGHRKRNRADDTDLEPGLEENGPSHNVVDVASAIDDVTENIQRRQGPRPRKRARLQKENGCVKNLEKRLIDALGQTCQGSGSIGQQYGQKESLTLPPASSVTQRERLTSLVFPRSNGKKDSILSQYETGKSEVTNVGSKIWNVHAAVHDAFFGLDDGVDYNDMTPVDKFTGFDPTTTITRPSMVAGFELVIKAEEEGEEMKKKRKDKTQRPNPVLVTAEPMQKAGTGTTKGGRVNKVTKPRGSAKAKQKKALRSNQLSPGQSTDLFASNPIGDAMKNVGKSALPAPEGSTKDKALK